jgi:cellulose synthase/poly-beta-1,6-N-acetylglucosamine synthase-like glycosyltransferase
MYLTRDLRHFDRGSGEALCGKFLKPGLVFGGTGACLLLKRACVEDVSLGRLGKDEALYRLYPFLEKGSEKRHLLFDESFFAYREDAELAWRMQLLAWQTLFCPGARAFHKRLVLPSNRSSLPSILNRLSVRNRFLLQIHCFHFWDSPQACF